MVKEENQTTPKDTLISILLGSSDIGTKITLIDD